ncbi:MAG: hypothetical protein IPN77_11030 [Sandaracinaceae bacterium]|nr:hypothetical protein [Sandaracinaceae bacterium]
MPPWTTCIGISPITSQGCPIVAVEYMPAPAAALTVSVAATASLCRRRRPLPLGQSEVITMPSARR